MTTKGQGESSIETEAAQLPLDAQDARRILRENKIDTTDDLQHPVRIALRLGLVATADVSTEDSGTFNMVDKARMIQDGQLVYPVAFGQSVVQIIELPMPQDIEAAAGVNSGTIVGNE